MNTLHKTLLTSSILSISNFLSAQTRDSIPQKVAAYVAEKFPMARDFNVEFTQLTPYRFSSKLHDADLPENKVKNFSQVKVSSNINLIKTKKWILSTNLNYCYTGIDTENSISGYPRKNDFHYHSETLSLTYFSKLLKKTTVYSASFSVDGSEQHFERMRGIITGTMILKANAKTKMTVGLVGIIDPTSQVPVIPTFGYEHKFDNGLIADFILPKRILIKKNVSENGRVSLGSEMENTSFYIYDGGRTYEFRQLEINSGAIYEHKIGSFIATLKTGIRAVPNSRIFEKNESFKNYFFEATPKTSFYCNVGISYNPFGKPKTK